MASEEIPEEQDASAATPDASIAPNEVSQAHPSPPADTAVASEALQASEVPPQMPTLRHGYDQATGAFTA